LWQYEKRIGAMFLNETYGCLCQFFREELTRAAIQAGKLERPEIRRLAGRRTAAVVPAQVHVEALIGGIKTFTA
jgi:hypothetical protein